MAFNGVQNCVFVLNFIQVGERCPHTGSAALNVTMV